MNRAIFQRLVCALSTTVVLFAWQAAIVHFNYGGNWSALFLTGDKFPVPTDLVSSTYVFEGSPGYDGQFYRYVAHDPLFKKGYAASLDDAKFRYGRILIPALAALLSLRTDRFVDAAYVAVVLIFVFLGTWWLSGYAAAQGRNPRWGALFGVVPATLLSIQRMTVDVALAAFCVAFVWFVLKNAPIGLYVVAVLAALTRDTGVLIAAACCLHALMNLRWWRAAVFATAVIPAYAWQKFAWAQLPQRAIEKSVPVVPQWLMRQPIVGIFEGFGKVPVYPHLDRVSAHFSQALDMAAIAGILVAIGLVIWQVRRVLREPEMLGAFLFAGLAAAVSAPTYWSDVNGYARTLSPLILFLGMRVLAGGSVWNLAPWLMVDSRLSLDILGAVRRLFH